MRAGATRDISRLGALSPGNHNPYILRSVHDTNLFGTVALEPNRSSLRQQFQIFIRDFFLRHAGSDKKLAGEWLLLSSLPPLRSPHAPGK